LKFTEKEGKVKVFIEYSTNNDVSLPQHVTIKIQDEGIGISKEKLPKIFDRFYQVDTAQNRGYEGTGIGLALVKELVEVMKGEIFVESKENFGTTFIVKLPFEACESDNVITENETIKNQQITEIESNFLSSETSVNNYQNELEDRRLSQKSEKDLLLIIDDNADIRQYLRSIFEKEYQIIEAIDGEDGLQKAIAQTPDVIISDLMMPKMDGFELCKSIKTNEKTSHIPVILLTAKATIESRIEGFEHEADDYLTKPFNRKEIKARVRNVILVREKMKNYFSEKVVNLKPNEIKVSSLDEIFIQKAIAIIEQNLSDSKYDVVQFSQEMNMSASQLLRKLKALTNLTANEFIRDFRLHRAAELLSKKSGTVSEIAFQVGFEHLSYFSKVFQEKFGQLPSEYVDSK
jgi:DNA-binding response OmpR family regulator